MWHITRRLRAGFTLTEILMSTFIALYVLTSAWSIYIMTWKWWHEISPSVESQRIARIALSSIIYGHVDSTAGSDQIGMSVYVRRNGIACALFDSSAQPPETPVISADKKRIDFRLERDVSNARAFYLETDAVTGVKEVYYLDDSGTIHKLDATKGITDLQFDYFVDAGGIVRYNIIKVTAKVERDIGTGASPYPVRVTYVDYAYLRNTL